MIKDMLQAKGWAERVVILTIDTAQVSSRQALACA